MLAPEVLPAASLAVTVNVYEVFAVKPLTFNEVPLTVLLSWPLTNTSCAELVL